MTKYTPHQIKTALTHMQGFVDISPQDVVEIITTLEMLYPQHKRKKRSPRMLRIARYRFLKFTQRKTAPASDLRNRFTEYAASWLFSFLGMLALGMLGQFHIAYMFIIGSFGASAVLIYGIPRSPLSQPRNVVGGHVLSAIVGVSMHLLVPSPLLCSALAVSCAILLMHMTGTLHPPGGATALIATIGGDKIHDLGYLYVFSPVLCGALVMVGMARVMNNTVSGRRYPDRWG